MVKKIQWFAFFYSIKIFISVNLAFHPGMTNDIVFDGNINTHRITEDGKATINFDGIYYVSALRFVTGNKKIDLPFKLKEL